MGLRRVVNYRVTFHGGKSETTFSKSDEESKSCDLERSTDYRASKAASVGKRYFLVVFLSLRDFLAAEFRFIGVSAYRWASS